MSARTVIKHALNQGDTHAEVTPTRTGGVSLVKVTDDVRHWNYADCGHYAQLGPRGDYLHTNSLPLLAVFFGSSSDGGFFETV